MNREECAKLAIYVGELCPQQHIGKATGLVWHDVLGRFGYTDCIEAVTAVNGRQPFISPSAAGNCRTRKPAAPATASSACSEAAKAAGACARAIPAPSRC